MSYLRRFPIDKLKIDRCFVEEMTRRPEDASIVRAIISLAHSLHLKVIAEGVETSEQLALLAELGCDQYQGFHFSAALLPERFAALMKQEQVCPMTRRRERTASWRHWWAQAAEARPIASERETRAARDHHARKHRQRDAAAR